MLKSRDAKRAGNEVRGESVERRVLQGRTLRGWAPKLGAWALLSAPLLVGCGLIKDEKKCEEGLKGVRASLDAGDRVLLERWRAYAHENCSDKAELAKLDQDAGPKLAAFERTKAEAEQRATATKQLLAIFLDWSGGNKLAPENASVNVTCEGDEAAEKSKERWCVRSRQAGPHALEVRYWEKEPAAVRFMTKLPGAITCADLGAHQVVRAWTVQGNAKRQLCEVTAGPAAGMRALVTEALGAPLYLFSPRYLELDTGFQTLTQGS
jgi:hypothetical protein